MPDAIARLKELLAQCEHVKDIRSFEEWAMRAEEIRSLRNYYVHATWDYLPLKEEHPLVFRIPPCTPQARLDQSLAHKWCPAYTPRANAHGLPQRAVPLLERRKLRLVAVDMAHDGVEAHRGLIALQAFLYAYW